MNADITLLAKSPLECDIVEREDFAALVLAGGEVIRDGLESRIKQAKALFFLRSAECLVGIAALKNPSEGYRAEVFKKAGITQRPELYPLELGWVFVLASSRGIGLSHRLVGAAVTHSASTPIFATSRTDNLGMHTALIRASFVRNGKDYASSHGTHRLALFLRDWPRNNTQPLSQPECPN